MKHYYKKMCNVSISGAANLFAHMNFSPLFPPHDTTPRVVYDKYSSFRVKSIIISKEPSSYIYPEGWYYYHGYFTNERTTTTNNHAHVPMMKPNGESWAESAPYCTLDFERVEFPVELSE